MEKMEIDEEEANVDSYDFDGNVSELNFSIDDDLIDPNVQLADMFNELLHRELDSDIEMDETIRPAKRLRAETIDVRPNKRKRGEVMPTTYSETEIEVEVSSTFNGMNIFIFTSKVNVF